MSLRLHPWLTIWTSPRATMRGLREGGRGRLAPFLMMLIGLRLALDSASIVAASDVVRADRLLRDGAWMGPVLGLALVYLGALAIWWTGRWFSGEASFLWVESAVAWAGLPSIAG